MEPEKSITEKHDLDGSRVEMEHMSSEALIDHAAEKKLLRKMDIRIMPLIMSLYLFVRTTPAFFPARR